MEIYGRVRRAVLVEGRSERAVAREFGMARETVRKMLRLFGAAGLPAESSQRSGRSWGRGLASSTPFWKKTRTKPAKQRHTAKRIFDRLRQEHALHRRLHDREGLRARCDACEPGRCSCR